MANKDETVIMAGEVSDYEIYGMTDADAGRNWVPPRPPNLPKPIPDERVDISNSQATAKTGDKKP